MNEHDPVSDFFSSSPRPGLQDPHLGNRCGSSGANGAAREWSGLHRGVLDPAAMAVELGYRAVEGFYQGGDGTQSRWRMVAR